MNNKYLPYFIMTIAVVALITTGITMHPIELWDESRNAINAYEMYRDGYSLSTSYLSEEVDMWNTKPPLLIWLQVTSMHIFGVNEWSVRLPSIVAGIITCLIMARWMKQETGRDTIAFLSAIILVTSTGFNGYHVVRTGDFDALLVMNVVAASYHFFYFIKGNSVKHLYFFFIFTTLAVLTKSIAGLLFLPGLLIYSIYARSLMKIIRNPHVYFGIIGLILVVGLYYFSREQVTPGYIDQVIKNEISGRFLENLDQERHAFYHYLKTLRMPYWIVFLPLVLYFLFKKSDKKHKDVLVFSTTFVLTFLVIISSSETKHAWYDASIYPFLAVLIAISLDVIIDVLLSKNMKQKIVFKNMILALIIATPIAMTLERNYNPPKNKSSTNVLSIYIRDLLDREDEDSQEKYFLVSEKYNPNVLFYTFSDMNKSNRLVSTQQNLMTENMSILTDDEKVLQYAKQQFEVTIVTEKEGLIHFITEFKL